MIARIVIWVVLVSIISFLTLTVNVGIQPEIQSDIALRQMERSDTAAVEMRASTHAFQYRGPIAGASIFLVSLMLFWPELSHPFKRRKGSCDEVRD